MPQLLENKRLSFTDSSVQTDKMKRQKKKKIETKNVTKNETKKIFGCNFLGYEFD